MAILAGAKVDAADLTALGAAWTAYTPTLTNLTGGAASGAFAQVGKTLFLRGNISAGTVTAAGIVSISLPAGLTLATSVIVGCATGRVVRSGLASVSTNLLEVAAVDGTNLALAASMVNTRWTGVVEVV